MSIDGKYFDGKTPVSKTVRCIVTEDSLVIQNSETAEILTIWKRTDIFHDENHNTAFVIGQKTDRAKIELFNLEIASQLGIHEQSKKTVRKDLKAIYKWIGIVAAACVIFWLSIPFISRVAARQIPFEYEVKAAALLDKKINEYFKPCSMSAAQDKALRTYVEFLYPKTEDEKKMPINFQVTNNPMVNAFTFPGGKILLMKGLIAETKSPEELLGIMGHEMGHVMARDSAGFIVRGALLAGFFSFLTGDFSGSFAVSPQLLLSTAALTFDRDMEKAADAYAAKRLNLLDVTTSGLRSFFSRRSYEDGFIPPEMLMTHPEYKSRINLITETYPKTALPGEIVDAWPVIRTICDK